MYPDRMSDNTKNPEEAAEAARRLLEATVDRRVEAVRSIVSAANDTESAQTALTDAQSRHTKAWSDALAAGWSEKELRATGAPRPGQSRAKTPRSRRSSAAAEPAPESAEAYA